MGSGGERLLEREAESTRLGDLLDEARSGRGGVALIEGPAGVGKTSLLRHGIEVARPEGMLVLDARCGQLEQAFPFGVCLQLLAAPVAALAAEDARPFEGAAGLARPLFETGPVSVPPPDENRLASLLHGLHRLMAALAERAPLLIAVDDAQWCDDPSLRFLDFLGRRVGELPVAVCVTVRAGEPAPRPSLIEALRDLAAGAVLTPRPLSMETTIELARAELDGADDATARACAQATGGNPFYLHELLRALRERDGTPSADVVSQLAGRGIRTVARSALTRIARLGKGARDLAQAIAVLGDGTPLRRAASLAALEPDRAVAAADALRDADLLAAGRGLSFAHPIVRQSVYADIAPAARARAHGLAARLLADESADTDAIAAQLLRAERLGQTWAVAALERAAHRARGRGALDAALRYLRRALDEPPPRDARARVLHALANAETATGDPQALDRLREALAAAEDPALRAEVAASLARALLFAAQGAEGVAVLRGTLAGLGEGQDRLRLELRTELLGLAQFDTHTRQLVRGDLSAAMREAGRLRDEPELPLLAIVAFETMMSEATAEEGAELAERALAGGTLLRTLPPDHPAVVYAIATLQIAGRRRPSDDYLQAAAAAAEESGSVRALGVVACLRSRGSFRWGRVGEAEHQGRTALELSTEHGWPMGVPVAVACVADPLIERGELHEARKLLETFPFEGPLAEMQLFQQVRECRARLELAAGQPAAALRLARACGAWERAWGASNSVFTHHPWRATVALAQLALGERDEAIRVAGEQVEIARAFGAPRELGIALRVAGLSEGGQRGLHLLDEAVRALSETAARLEYARALAELGSALRRARRKPEARKRLYEALELARRCDGSALAGAVRDELRASGARPRREATRGAAALTPMERRVAELAAEGLGNREVAQRLFLARRTVETHLTSAYRKLAIEGRDDLAAALAPAGVSADAEPARRSSDRTYTGRR